MSRKPETTISAVLIVKDEEECLARCLESVRWVDEIVVYDTGSSDRTVEIARRFTDTVVEGYWDDDFGAARNRAIARATGEWVLVVDADEQFVGSPHTVRKHLGSGRANFFTIPVGTQVVQPGTIDPSATSVRFFRRSDGQYAGALHEQVVNRPGVRRVLRPLPGASITHTGYSEGPEAMEARFRRNLEIAERELEAARDAGQDGHEVAIRESNLARSLVGAGRREEGMELGERVHDGGALPNIAMESFARAMAITAAAHGDTVLARQWAGRLRAVANHPVWADTVLVEISAAEHDPVATLDALELVPTTMVDEHGRQVRRVEYSRYEVWALWKLGRARDVRRAAVRAAAAGVLPGQPHELWEWVGEDGLREVVEALTEDAWQLLGVLCTHVGATEAARNVLDLMARVRPGDLAVLLCARELRFPADLAGLEEAATWSARMRTAGLEEYCTLVALAQDVGTPAPQRARAAALAHFAYGDPRALPALEDALAAVAPEDEAELAAHLDVLAPGLVQRA
ncbi:glycosyltransferase family 2 protein [Georgenia sp. 311]|uniref:glycosyltransferase family 2 protein n=1 Tax=Georgenia sp. 311 TaxID=2585134 RepID=UPI001111935F|nr:glycosyltransferase family 2 protein [Georgenia sp. 311]TNC17603.1 glycosyltransferase family 2 protein [Georgenia sp. 311]